MVKARRGAAGIDERSESCSKPCLCFSGLGPISSSRYHACECRGLGLRDGLEGLFPAGRAAPADQNGGNFKNKNRWRCSGLAHVALRVGGHARATAFLSRPSAPGHLGSRRTGPYPPSPKAAIGVALLAKT